MNHPVSGVAYQTADNYILVSKYRVNRPALKEFTTSQARVALFISNPERIYTLDTKEADVLALLSGLNQIRYSDDSLGPYKARILLIGKISDVGASKFAIDNGFEIDKELTTEDKESDFSVSR